jgi:pimeloyl-ACP methyl ester carboxylesterase
MRGKHLNQLNGIYLNPDNDPGDFVPLRSPLPQLHLLNTLVVNLNFSYADIWLTPEMHKIKIPSMVLWGRHDGTLPVELAYDAYDNLGTEEDKKELHIFEHSAHGCSFEEPELFIEIMTNFIDKYK